MPALSRPRHEALAQAIFNGIANGDSRADWQYYQDVGYGRIGNRGNSDNYALRCNASRMLHKSGVLDRVRELQAQAAHDARITAASIIREYEDARQIAREEKQASAMVAATSGKAKIAGLDVQRIEHGSPGDFSQAQSKADIADSYIRAANPQIADIKEEMRDAMLSELARHMSNVQAIANGSLIMLDNNVS